jgi:predicted esterase
MHRRILFALGLALCAPLGLLVALGDTTGHERQTVPTIGAEADLEASKAAVTEMAQASPPVARSVWDASTRGVAVALVAPPVAAAAPILVAVHGSNSNAEWNCPRVRSGFGDNSWLVCIHPSAHLGHDESWSSAAQVRQKVDEAVTALVAKVGARANASALHVIGHSQGAVLAPVALGLPGRRITSLTLFEGPPNSPRSEAAALKRAGVERVLLVTGSNWGAASTLDFSKELNKIDLPARLVVAGGGHFFGPASDGAIRPNVDWLLPNNASPTSPLSAAAGATNPPGELDAVAEDAYYLDGTRAGIVNVPQGVRSKRPIVVAFHAAGVGPEWICAAARRWLGDYPIVVCPDAAPSASSAKTVIESLWRYREYIDFQQAAYVGYSQGAIQSAAVLDPLTRVRDIRFTQVLLIEGLPTFRPPPVGTPGEAPWPYRLRAAGLTHALIVSGQGGWAAGHGSLARTLSAQGVQAEHLALAFGHVPNDEAIVAIERAAAPMRSALGAIGGP